VEQSYRVQVSLTIIISPSPKFVARELVVLINLAFGFAARDWIEGAQFR
jgi:hypothetical protein